MKESGKMMIKRCKSMLMIAMMMIVSVFVLAGCSSDKTASSSTPAGTPTVKIEGVDVNNLSPELKKIYDRGTLIVGNDSSYPPFGFIDPATNQAMGVEKEMAGKIAEKLSQVLGKPIKLDFQSMNFDAVLSSLTTGKIDLACSAVTVTEPRKKVMAFSNPYLHTSDVFLFLAGNKDKYHSLNDFKEVKLAANTGSSQEVRANTLSSQITSTPTIADGIMQLKSGSVDAVIVDNITGLRYVKTNPDLSSYEISDKEVKPQDKSVAMQKDSPDLMAVVNAVVAEQTKDGNVEKWINEYTDKAVSMGLGK